MMNSGGDSVRELIVTDVLVSGLRGQHGDGGARPGPCVLWLAAQAGIWLAAQAGVRGEVAQAHERVAGPDLVPLHGLLLPAWLAGSTSALRSAPW